MLNRRASNGRAILINLRFHFHHNSSHFTTISFCLSDIHQIQVVDYYGAYHESFILVELNWIHCWQVAALSSRTRGWTVRRPGSRKRLCKCAWEAFAWVQNQQAQHGLDFIQHPCFDMICHGTKTSQLQWEQHILNRYSAFSSSHPQLIPTWFSVNINQPIF